MKFKFYDDETIKDIDMEVMQIAQEYFQEHKSEIVSEISSKIQNNLQNNFLELLKEAFKIKLEQFNSHYEETEKDYFYKKGKGVLLKEDIQNFDQLLTKKETTVKILETINDILNL